MFSKSLTFFILNVLNDIFPYMEITTPGKRLTNLIFFSLSNSFLCGEMQIPHLSDQSKKDGNSKALASKISWEAF